MKAIKRKIKIKYKIKTIILAVILILAVIMNIVIAATISKNKSNLNGKIQGAVIVDTKFSEINQLQEKGCPEVFAGNEQSVFKIKYFYSDFCGYCKKQEPILKELLKENGDMFYIEYFNIDHCGKEFLDYGAVRVPTFIFKSGDLEEITHPSFVYKKDLKNLICKSNGGCINE